MRSIHLFLLVMLVTVGEWVAHGYRPGFAAGLAVGATMVGVVVEHGGGIQRLVRRLRR